MNGVERIALERLRQIAVEGWTEEHDDEHRYGELAIVAAQLAIYDTDAEITEPHDLDSWGLIDKHLGAGIRRLEIAGALIAAEIDRMLRRGDK